MAQFYERETLVRMLENKRNGGAGLLMMGCGSGLSVTAAEKGGADLLSVYSTAILRMEGVPTPVSMLPYSDCNALTQAKAKILLPLVKEVPCLAGVGAHSPFLDMDRYLDTLKEMKFSGVVNEPFVAGYGKEFAAKLEQAGCGFSCEVAMIRRAHDKGLFTAAWCSSEAEAQQMADAGADLIGIVLFEKHTCQQEALEALQAVADAARNIHPGVLTLAHGGPFRDVQTATPAVQGGIVDGYACGSNGEKDCALEAIYQNVCQYRSMK